MRISSRGTITMGPLGWLLFIVVVGPFLLAIWTARLLALLVMAAARAASDARARRELR